MDYREQYLSLKNKLLNQSSQSGSGQMNPAFMNELSDLSFLVGDNILEDNVRAVLLALIEEFNKIASLDLHHNLELSQYYAVNKGLMTNQGSVQCENCEIVLKYTDTPVCLTNGRVGQYIQKEGNKYYKDNKQGEKIEVQCDIGRGLVRFYLKQKVNKKNFEYTRIRVAKVKMVPSLNYFSNALYQDTDVLTNIEETTNQAISQAQADVISKASKTGQLSVTNPADIPIATSAINTIVSQTKDATTKSQLAKINTSNIASALPSQTSVNIANTIARNVMNTPAAKEGNLSVVLTPGNEPIPFQSSVSNTTATIANIGTTANTANIMSGNAGSTVSRASLAVDSNVAVVPTQNIISDKAVEIADASKKSVTSVTNKLASVATSIGDKASEVVRDVVDDIGSAAQNIVGYFKGTPTKSTATATKSTATATKSTASATKPASTLAPVATPSSVSSSIVPVSESLSILTALPKGTASAQVPVPENESASILYSHNITNRFNNQLKTNAANNIYNINTSKQAKATLQNGYNSVTRNQSIRQKTEMTVENTDADTDNNLTEKLVLSDMTETNTQRGGNQLYRRRLR